MTIRLTQTQIETMHKLKEQKYSIAEIARVLGVTRPTVYKAFELYPEPPSKVKLGIPKYVEEFENSTTVKRFKEDYEGKLKNYQQYIAVARKAWLFLEKKDPMNWDEEDYRKLWNYEGFRDEATGLIRFTNAVILRKWMVHCKRFDLPERPEFSTKGLKRPKGAKKTHYIKTFDDMVRFIYALNYPDTLMLFMVGSQCGARFSSLAHIRPQDIDYTQNAINMYEPKVKKYVYRKFNTCTLEQLKRFIADFNIQGDQMLFKRSIESYNEEFRNAGKAIGIDFKVTTHTGMKHTFVSLASAHDVSLEVVSEQCGTDPQTIREFYLGGLEKKMDAELLDRRETRETWKQFVEKLAPYFADRYEKIKGNMFKVNGLAKKPMKEKKAKPKRAFSWDRIEAIVKSPEPQNPKAKRLWQYWKQVWRIHEQHPKLTFQQIKERI